MRKRICPPQSQSVDKFSKKLDIHVMTIYSWPKVWQPQEEVVPASQKDPEGWGTAEQFTVVLETTDLNTTELGGYFRERRLFHEQIDRWRQAAQDANAQPLLTMRDQKDLQKRHQEHREIKRLQKELRRKEKALAETAAFL